MNNTLYKAAILSLDGVITQTAHLHAKAWRLVVGVARHGEGNLLQQHGADRVVQALRELHNITLDQPDLDQPDLDQLDLDQPEDAESHCYSALKQFDQIEQQLNPYRLALFTDYDGTLTPIVDRPEAAILSEEMRSLLKTLSHHIPVAVISGRDVSDVQNKVKLENLYYAGSHGFDIVGPDRHQQQESAQKSLPDLDHAEQQLREQLSEITGVQVERKRFAIAVHYRGAAESAVESIKTIVDRVTQSHPQLRQQSGKKIFELQPDVPWHKGKAIDWLLNQLNLNQPDVIPMYLGDDTTDEDAFRALADRGISIYVGNPNHSTHATYFLHNPAEVQQFFQQLVRLVSSSDNPSDHSSDNPSG